MMPTIQDVCRKSGVSTATVSRVLNNSPHVSRESRRRVLDAIDELGYRPSQAARNLVRQSTETIGVVFPHIGSGFYSEVLRGIDQVAGEYGYHLLTAFAHGVSDETQLATRTITDGRADAVILLNLDLPEGVIRKLAGNRTPIVLVDRPLSGGGIAAVTIDNQTGAALAMSHLLEHGYRDIVVLAGPGNSYDSNQRLAGCRSAAARVEYNLADDRIWCGGFTAQSGRDVVRKQLSGGRKPPGAILALNDAMALGAYMVLRSRGWRVPEDVALIGFDDCESAEFVGLTTVHVPMLDLGRAAAETTMQLVEGRTSVKGCVMPTHLVVRESCGCGR